VVEFRKSQIDESIKMDLPRSHFARPIVDLQLICDMLFKSILENTFLVMFLMNDGALHGKL
jgi:hypothetical protein